MTDLAAPLANTLKAVAAANTEGKTILFYLFATVRNEETLQAFLDAFEQQGFTWTSEPIVPGPDVRHLIADYAVDLMRLFTVKLAP